MIVNHEISIVNNLPKKTLNLLLRGVDIGTFSGGGKGRGIDILYISRIPILGNKSLIIYCLKLTHSKCDKRM